MPRPLLLLLVLPGLAACPLDSKIVDDPETTDMSSSTGSDPTGEPTTTGGEPVTIPVGECDFGPAITTRLAIVTNNFVDPAALHILDLATDELTADVAPAPADPALAWGDGKLVVIGRYGFNSLDVRDGDDWSSLAALTVRVDGVAEPNPQALTFAADGRAYLTLLASAAVPIYDLTRPAADNPVGALDLAAFADDDGSPEAGVALACGGVMLIGIQRLVDFTPVDHSYLVPIDLATRQPIDLDPTTEGPQAIELLGAWPKQIRRDPTDQGNHTALVLTSGVERVDLVHGTTTWAVTPERLAARGIEGFDVQCFAVAPDDASVYIAATDGDFPSTAVFQFSLTDDSSATIVSGLTTREKVLEVVGDTLWVGDSAVDEPRLRAFDLTRSPPAELAPVPTPGDPYLVLALP